jgi:hypothetical protein
MGGARNTSTGATGRDAWTPKGYKLKDKYKDVSPTILAMTNMFSLRGVHEPQMMFYDKIPQRNSMKVHSFDNPYVSRASDFQQDYKPPSYDIKEYQSVLPGGWGQAEMPGTRTPGPSPGSVGTGNSLKIGQDPIVQGVKTKTRRRRGGSGRSRSSSSTSGGSYETAEGAGLNI